MEIKVTPTVELFFNEESFFGIYGCDVNPNDQQKVTLNSYGNISIKGNMPTLEIGSEYVVAVKEDFDSKYKGSYIVESIHQEKPATITEQRKFFEMLLTENQVNNIFEVYEGQDVIQMIQDGTFDYSNVKGIGEATFKKMREKVLNNLEMGELLVFLAKNNIKYSMVSKLIQEYGNPQIVIDKISKNPYVLTEVKGIGFIRADEIARAMGHSVTSKHRIESCLNYCILEEGKSGHSWISRRELISKAVDLLNIKRSYIESVLKDGVKNILNIDDRYTHKSVYDSEKYVATKIIEFKSRNEKVFETDELEGMIDEYCEENNVELEENQRQFFHDWNENGILMLIGYGGTGKSWLQRILLEFIAKKSMSTVLLAPTGRASKVMSNYTGRYASTIHRRVGVFGEDADGTKEIFDDIVIVDETSMCDIFILAKLFKAIKGANTRILFVGDDFQLPSVGVGNFLYDVLNSKCVKVSKLTKVFRQDDGGILNVATDVREGTSFLNGSDDGRIVFGKDCVFWITDQEYIRDGVISQYKRVAKRFNQEDITILTPTNKGKLGTIALNKDMQKIANPASPTKKEKSVGSKKDPTVFRVGDLVMNTVNTYDIETINGGKADIFNGDTGKIIDIDEAEKVFIIDIEDIVVKIKFGEILGRFVHSWVTTIHKSQGSQYKVVIVVTDRSMTYQLNANLLYTGFSRAESYMLVLTQAQTINRAMKKFANMERRSFLKEMLERFSNEDFAEDVFNEGYIA